LIVGRAAASSRSIANVRPNSPCRPRTRGRR
jgi:hypothetical protein